MKHLAAVRLKAKMNGRTRQRQSDQDLMYLMTFGSRGFEEGPPRWGIKKQMPRGHGCSLRTAGRGCLQRRTAPRPDAHPFDGVRCPGEQFDLRHRSNAGQRLAPKA